MPNQELFGLVDLLVFRTQEDHSKALNFLYSNPVRSIESLIALLKVRSLPGIASQQLEKAKLAASTCLNYMLKVGVKEVDGLQELGTFWDIFFDWKIDMAHKLNLEDTFQYLYKFWYAKHEKIFEQGMTKIIRILNRYSNNDCELNTSVKLTGENCEFFLWMDGYSSIANVLQSLLLIGRCCMSSLICEREYYEGFTTIMDNMAALFRAIKKWNPEARVEMAKLETINWMIDCLVEADLEQRTRRSLIDEVYRRGKMSDMIMETYNKGRKSHQGIEKEICWLCSEGNVQQRNNLLSEKETMAKIHLRFVMNGKNFYERIHTFLEKEEEFEPSLISTLYCFTSSGKWSHNAPQSFVSSLLELYITHFKHYPQVFSNIYQTSFSHIAFPLMRIDHYKSQELESDPLFLVNLLENVRLGHTLDVPLVKAAALLRYIVVRSHIFYEKIMQNILKFFRNQQFDEEFWELKRPSLDSCLLILITLSQNLKDDKLNSQKLLLVFNKGIEIMLSNLSLCLMAFFFKVMMKQIDNPIVSQRFYDLAKEGLQRNTGIKHFMMELYIQDQEERFSWSFLQSAFKGLFLRRQEDTSIVYYQEIIEGSIKYHNRLLSTQDILQLLTCSIDFCQQKIIDNPYKVSKNLVIFTLRFIRCAFNVCSPEILSSLNSQVTNLLTMFQRTEYLQFQEQTLGLILAYFNSQEAFTNQHLLLTQSFITTYKSSENHELCLVIFSRIITNASQLSIPILLIFGQLSNIVKQMKWIGEKDEKKLFQELLIIQYCIRSKGQSLGFDKVTSLISQLLLLLEKSASPIIRCRTLNIMLASRQYVKIDSINWAFIIKVVESFRMPYDQQFLAVMNIEVLVQDISNNKKVQEYANILKFLDKILRVTNRKAKVIDPICNFSHFLPVQQQEQTMEQKAKKIVLNILQKKRFTFRLIEERMNNDEIKFLRRIELCFEEESTGLEVKAISFLCS